MRRVGLIIPSSNVVVEDTIRRRSGSLDPDMRFHIARLPVVQVDTSEQATKQFEWQALDAAADRLTDADVDRIVFAGTAGAWLGIDREKAWQQHASSRTGLPVMSTVLATLDVLHGVDGPVSLVTPFSQGIHSRIVDNLQSEDVAMATGSHLGLASSREMADVTPENISNEILECLDRADTAVLCFCTNFRGHEACDLVRAARPDAQLLDSVEITLEAASAL